MDLSIQYIASLHNAREKKYLLYLAVNHAVYRIYREEGDRPRVIRLKNIQAAREDAREMTRHCPAYELCDNFGMSPLDGPTLKAIVVGLLQNGLIPLAA